ncbi:MAG: hypothetical protein NZM35_10445 [Chitinophagales bacterium]|nr:hypothetical protein [Chitinophagales bacterium]
MKKRDLFILIHSLTPAEKKFFKEYVRADNQGNNYMRLFDAIAEQPHYDDNALKEKFRGEKLINNFHVMKAYLYDLILEALRHMDIHQNSITHFRRLMDEAQLLFEKNLFDLAIGQLEKARDICNQMELPLQKSETILLQLRILNRQDLVYAGKYFTEVCYPELSDLILSLQQMIDIKHLHKKISYVANTNGRFRSADDENAVNKLMEHELVTQPEKLKSFDTIFAYYSIKAYYYWLKNDIVNAFDFEEKKWLLYKNFPMRIKENIKDAATMLYNLIHISYSNYWNEKAHHYLKILQNLPASTKEERFYVRNKFVRAQLVQLRSAPSTQHKKLSHLITDIIKEFQSISNNIEPIEKLRTLYEMIVVLMIYGRFADALNFIQQFTGEKSAEELRPIHYPYIKIFNLICHFELHNYEYLLNIINNTEYALKKSHKLFQIEQMFIRSFRKLVHLPKRQHAEQVMELRSQLDAIAKDQYEKIGLGFIDQVMWFDKYRQ